MWDSDVEVFILNQSHCIFTLLQPFCWRYAECAVHHEWNVREEQHHMYVVRTSNNRVISSGELYCCLLPQCEALRTCLSGFPLQQHHWLYQIFESVVPLILTQQHFISSVKLTCLMTV